jgi:glutamyl-tRNA reductase
MSVAWVISQVKAAYQLEYSNSGMTKVLHELVFFIKNLILSK